MSQDSLFLFPPYIWGGETAIKKAARKQQESSKKAARKQQESSKKNLDKN
jgi:hypothetical protein